MALSDYIPNVFGQAAPSYLQGLLGAEETQNLQNRANVQGLLGAGLALAQGMSRTGPRRSAAENILGALSGGFGAAGGAYEQGVKNYVTQQQIAQTQLAQTQAANKLRSIAEAKRLYPDIAALADIDPGKFAEEVALRQRMQGFNLTGKETPQELEAKANQIYATGVAGLKPYADSLMQKAQGMALLPPSVQTANQPAAQPAVQTAQQPRLEPGLGVTAKGDTFNGVPNYAAGERYVDEAMHQKALESQRTLPPVQKDARSQFESQINNIDNELLRVQQLQPTEANTRYQTNLRARREILLKDVDRFAVMEYDFTDLSSLPNKYQSEVNQIKRQAQGGALDSSGLNSRIQNLYTKLQEDEKGRALTGNAAVFAQMKFGVTDRTKLSGPQLAEILLFEDAPTATQSAELSREALRLRADVGVVAPLPAARGPMIFAPAQGTNQVPVNQAPAVQPVTTQQSGGQQPPARPANQPTVTPVRASNAQVAAPTATRTSANAPERQPVVQSPYFKVDSNPLINRREIDLPIKNRQKLLDGQAGFISSNQYTLTNIIDARNVAKSLLDNPAYLDALTSRTAQLYAKSPAGITLDQNTFTANEILNNLQGRSFISEIQAMRANNPTGGGVGNVAVAEMTTLANIAAALKLGMTRPELVKQLQSFVDRADGSLKSIPNQYTKVYGYNGEFDDIFSREVVKPTATQNKPPRGVTVNRVP
jgi:hypothetical protein